ncbi:PepSY domain-containing protein [Staphylococcus simiae]|uniref:PepSY-associated TM helix domain-containing protein n=1 Tax=Staphylococcus simiae TaxID=308354 RepID=UPI001A968D1A|nr:PepSY domain-containing protein [Staphylococcus simiae]MBO1197849.1 PepSY domain-containing protein [Staphylococcus simiae]MBO1200040.1 PepSY domain-containing protein [Staphylococcus simiae]MBO1202313.1 PepSY domain-containing protein [Staphylococcus simiae]MBO1209840.1 PepSY domain-containing protein [Staphylococcus simiae]MBO1228457.1 PepSY domain-containing protein [Staphylococcus simiae]
MKNTFNPLQRLHFYAALFISPLLITLTISGIGYLFYPEVENNIYKTEFFGDSNITEHQSLNKAVHQVEHQFDGFYVSKVSVMAPPYNTRITIDDMAGNQRYVFLDHNNQIVSDQNAKHTYSNVMRNIHSSLFTENTIINYLVELTACWTIFMILSGTYLLVKKKLLTNKSKALRFQKWHAVIGVIIAVPVFILVLTGLPWSGFMGSKIADLMDNHGNLGQGQLAINPPKSDVNELPWATRKNKQPASESGGAHAHHGNMAMPLTNLDHQISIDKVVTNAEHAGIKKPFSIVYPSDIKGTFVVSNSSNTGVTGLDVSPYDEKTLYFDQYSGKNLGEIKYQQYGIIAKWFTWGIPLHEGHLFGIANKIINTLVCLLLLGAIAFGFTSWIKRVKGSSVKVPRRVKKPMSISVVVFLIILGVLMPLFGMSLIVIFIIEALLYVKDYKQKQS